MYGKYFPALCSVQYVLISFMLCTVMISSFIYCSVYTVSVYSIKFTFSMQCTVCRIQNALYCMYFTISVNCTVSTYLYLYTTLYVLHYLCLLYCMYFTDSSHHKMCTLYTVTKVADISNMLAVKESIPLICALKKRYFKIKYIVDKK